MRKEVGKALASVCVSHMHRQCMKKEVSEALACVCVVHMHSQYFRKEVGEALAYGVCHTCTVSA